MRSVLIATLLALAGHCFAQTPVPPSGLTDERPVPERRSTVELESYRTQISLSDDSMAPSPVQVFSQAVLAAMDNQNSPPVLKSLGLRISIPPEATSREVYRALNLPGGPPNVPSLLQAISDALSLRQGTSALVVCEAEAVIGGQEYRALVRESYARGLTADLLMAQLQQAAAELIADVKSRR